MKKINPLNVQVIKRTTHKKQIGKQKSTMLHPSVIPLSNFMSRFYYVCRDHLIRNAGVCHD